MNHFSRLLGFIIGWCHIMVLWSRVTRVLVQCHIFVSLPTPWPVTAGKGFAVDISAYYAGLNLLNCSHCDGASAASAITHAHECECVWCMWHATKMTMSMHALSEPVSSFFNLMQSFGCLFLSSFICSSCLPTCMHAKPSRVKTYVVHTCPSIHLPKSTCPAAHTPTRTPPSQWWQLFALVHFC